MLKIRALNREASSDEDTPVIRREAQEEIVLELYNKALRLQAQEIYSEAESILLKLIDENIPLLENNGGLPKSMSNLKYACHVNIGNIYLKLNRVNDALDRFLLASELDGTHVNLWYKIGNLSLKEDKFRQSAFAFAKGLECSESHWPCLDKIISVLFAIKDTIACLEYIGKALLLDPEYTKGLVLRRQIYKNNPATKDYYKLYNPDSIWEPSLDTPIDEEEERKYLKEVQILCDRLNDVEKSLAPKPLQVIALPKPLTEYNWLCLTETITYIHQYLTDNGMSHFTMFDMSKCMSQTEESTFKFPLDQVNDSKAVEDKVLDNKISQIPAETVTVTSEEKLGIEQVVERRFSQNSETAMEMQEITPVQTDNDEEQNTEMDNEEQDEAVEPKERGRPRGSKRKRDLLSDLQTWGWYSRRKLSKKAKEKDFTVEDALERIIPKRLLPYRIDPEKFGNFEDSMNTMDLYNMYVENTSVNYLSPMHSPKTVNYEQYFGTDKEREDVQEFWTKSREYYDAVVLIKDLVFQLSKLWHYKWPKQLIVLYIKAYNMFREHCDPPQVFCGGHTFEELRNDALASILFGELSIFSCDTKETIPPTLIGYMRLISGWQDEWKEEYPSFFIRVFWLQTHIFRNENNNDLAVNSLQLIQEAIEEEQEAKAKEKYVLSLPNCFKYGLINTEITHKILNHLDMINSLGTVENLYYLEKYKEVADILKLTFNDGPSPQVGRMGRPAQIGLLIHSLWYTDMTQCFIWTEECLNEAFEQYLKFVRDQDKWEKVVEKCLAVLYEIIKTDTICVIDYLEESKRSRIIQNLSKMISKQLNSDSPIIPLGCITPWILLHFVLLRRTKGICKKRISRGKKEIIELTTDNEDILNNSLPASVSILFSAHEFLGPKGWCMTNQGELLHFIIDTILDKLDTPIFERLRNKIDIHIEQAMFCLYQHPSKKNKVSRHLADHNVDPLPLSWERASQLFEFYGPVCLPEFNSYKNASISADLEQLFKRILALVPPNNAPQQHLPKIMDYIHGKTDKILDPIEFPRKVKPIYYLIGDFYFKQSEFSKSIKYFQMDLCINPLRLDSWACLGLSYAAQLDAKLNHCEQFKSETEFLDKAKYATICFTKALDICPDHLTLWIEYGTFQYTAHSYCSRIMKFESENLSMEKFEFLENQKNSYLDSSGNSFEKAIAIYETMDETNEADERWLQYYILGKIAEKKQKEPSEYLQYYLTASTLLEENNAEYPEKIHYNNPQHLSVEALELHYRINASVLKYLELHEGKEIPYTLGTFFKKCLSTSKYLKKPPPPVPPPPLPAPVPEPVSAPVPDPVSASVLEPISAPIPEPISAPVLEPIPPPPPTPPVESDVPNKISNSSSSFQEQFLNSLNKLSVPEKIETKSDDLLTNVSNKEPETIKDTDEEKNDVEIAEIKDNSDNDCIMISDSEDEGVKIVEIKEEEKENKTVEKLETGNSGDRTREEKNTEIINKENTEIECLKNYENQTETKIEAISEVKDEIRENEEDPGKMVIDNERTKNDTSQIHIDVENDEIPSNGEFKKEEPIQNVEMKTTETTKYTEEVEGSTDQKVKDVQTMLDEMMMQTMKETEENRTEVDSDLSGTEKVEEVVLCEQENEENKIESKSEVEMKPKKIKRNDGDTDTDNKRASVDDSSSGSSSSSSSSDSSDSDSDDDDDSSSSSSSSSSDGTNEFMSNSEITHLIEKCVLGLEICIIRLTQNYKALYRLAHLYFNHKSKKDLTKCRNLLLGDYECKDKTVVSGLFSDRKPTNFFNGIWRIPSTEIDRPGSLSAHMNRCLSLLLQILRTTNDNTTLIDLSIQLRKVPDLDKIYIKDSERIAFSDQAMTMCIQSLRAQMKHIPDMSNPQIAKILQEIFTIYQSLQKCIPGKETQFANLLVEVYKKFIKESIPENINILELAVKFCSHNKSAEKHRISGTSKPVTLTPRGPGVSSNSPVMPSPQSMNTQPMLLKRPGTTRPRGRPPLQKPGKPRLQRPKSPSAASLPKTYAWQKSLMDQSYAYEYLKHYQDELIKQYSQNLSIAQLTQLSQILTQGQINNPLTATAITSQMLAQTGLLNSNLLKQINSVGNVTQNTTTQLMDSLNQLNPNMKKKLGVDQALSSLTSDQLKLLGTLIPKQQVIGTHSKTSPAHTITSSSGIMASKQIKQQVAFQKQNVPSTSKTIILDSSKSKPSTVTSSSPKTQQVFKEPGSKIPSHDDRTAKDFMKDRPNISIIPVSVGLPPPPSVSPNFMRPTSTSPSSGKTLQEKLAEKKKEQQTKQMKSAGDEDKRQTDALMKSLNIPSIPSSLTVSPAQPIPLSTAKNPDNSVFTYQKTISPKFPMDISMQPSNSSKIPKEQAIPSSLTVSKAHGNSLSTPTFPVDSGISISQVATNQRKEIKDQSPPNLKQNNPKMSKVLILPVKRKPGNEVTIKKTKNENAKKAIEVRHKLPKDTPSKVTKHIHISSKQDLTKQISREKIPHPHHYEDSKTPDRKKLDYFKKYDCLGKSDILNQKISSVSSKKLEALSKSGLSVESFSSHDKQKKRKLLSTSEMYKHLENISKTDIKKFEPPPQSKSDKFSKKTITPNSFEGVLKVAKAEINTKSDSSDDDVICID